MKNRDLTQEEKNTLESMIDSANLSAVLEAISDICGEKAEHIRANWQDNALAKDWDTACGKIGLTVCNKAITRVSL